MFSGLLVPYFEFCRHQNPEPEKAISRDSFSGKAQQALEARLRQQILSQESQQPELIISWKARDSAAAAAGSSKTQKQDKALSSLRLSAAESQSELHSGTSCFTAAIALRTTESQRGTCRSRRVDATSRSSTTRCRSRACQAHFRQDCLHFVMQFIKRRIGAEAWNSGDHNLPGTAGLHHVMQFIKLCSAFWSPAVPGSM